MKTLAALIFLIAMVGFFSACVNMPDIRGGKVSSTESSWLPWWQARTHAEDMMEANGYAKPKPSLQDQSSLWLWIAATCAGVAILCFIGAYITHQHSLIAVGGILGLCAIVSTVVSALMFWFVVIGGPILLLVALYYGWKFKDFNIRHHLAEKASKKRMFAMRSKSEEN